MGKCRIKGIITGGGRGIFMSILLTEASAREMMSEFLVPEETIINIASGYVCDAFVGYFYFAAFTEARAILAKYTMGLKLKKLKAVPRAKFEREEKWIARSGLHLLPVGYPRVKKTAELSQYMHMQDEAASSMDPGEKLMTVGLVREGLRGDSDHHLMVFTDRRVAVLDASTSGGTEVSYASPLSDMSVYGIRVRKNLGPLDAPLFSNPFSELYLKHKNWSERLLYVTDVFGVRLQNDSPSSATSGMGDFMNAGTGLMLIMKQRAMASSPGVKAAGEAVLALADRLEALEERISDPGPSRSAHESDLLEIMAVRREIAENMPNLVERLDTRGNPLVAAAGHCRKQAAKLMSALE